MRSSYLRSWALLLVLLGTGVTAQSRTSSESESENQSRTRSATRTRTQRPSQTQTSTRTGEATHTIAVGPKEDPHQYKPRTVDAEVGDVIVFEFYPRNHSVVKADFGAPCVPADGDIFYSGPFNEFDEENGQLTGDPPTWRLRVNDTKPTFFYCTAVDSCIENGMVGAINPNKTMTWESQYQKALDYPYQLVPGEAPPAEGDVPETSATPSAAPSSPPSKGLSGGAIAGIVVGAVVGVGILVALFFVLGRNRVYRKWLTSEDGRGDRTRQWAMSGSGPSAAVRSDMGEVEGTVGSPKPGHVSLMSSDSPHMGHQSAQFSHFSRDASMYGSPNLHDIPSGPPQELSSSPGGMAELEAGPKSPLSPDNRQP